MQQKLPLFEFCPGHTAIRLVYKQTFPNIILKIEIRQKMGKMLIFTFKKWLLCRGLKIQITFIIAKSIPTCSAGHKDSKNV